jgi:hypothetical protein
MQRWWPGRYQEVAHHLFQIFVVEESVKELPQIGVCKGRSWTLWRFIHIRR